MIELRHLDLGEMACGRCSDTGENLLNVISELGGEHVLDDVEVEVRNILLPPNRADESNIVLINGIPLEEILGEKMGSAGCGVCSDFCGEQVLHYSRGILSAIPREVLREAILRVLMGERAG
ncbi:MAG: hypothetical protein APR55_06965 [Methanolinea sp. SDB]|nr:MAG: hypothetical protein APR55_06965 [Methanolinea sp. SDB]